MNKTANNYDKSSTGTDIEATCFYDTDTSQREFNENFKVLQHSGYSTNTVAHYVDNGNVPDDSAISFTLEGSETEIETAILKDGYTREEFKAMIAGEPFDILETAYGERVTLLNYEDFNKVYAPLKAVPSKNLVKVAIRGYYQGDYAEVYYCPDDLEKAWGNAPTESALKEMFTHYFYDAPIYASVTVNGTEYYYSDMPGYDEYEWKRDEFLDYVSKESGVDKEILGAVLPKKPSY